MEGILRLEATKREKELEVKNDVIVANPLTEHDTQKYEFMAYTDGACRTKKGSQLGSAAFIIFDKERNEVMS